MAWLTGWSYTKKITISGSTGAGTNYQVLLKVGESSGATGANFDVNGHSALFPSGKNDSGDLRFTASDGTTLLDFWVEKVIGTSPNRVAWCWVEVSADLGVNRDIYCYYGNLNAGNVSNGANTFILFDDFDGSTIDTTKWAVYTDGNATASVSGSELILSALGGSVAGDAVILNSVNSFPSSYAFRGRGRRVSALGQSHTGLVWREVNNRVNWWAVERWVYASVYNTTDDGRFSMSSDGGTGNGSGALIPISSAGATSENRRHQLATRDFSGVFDDSLSGTLNESIDGGWAVSNPTNYLGINANNYNTAPAFDFRWDWVLLRKFVSPEPAFSLAGAEELPSISRITFFPFNSAITSVSRITFTPFNIKNYLSKGMKMFFDITGLAGAPAKIKAIIKSVKIKFRVKMK